MGIRVGYGYDLHQLVEGRKCILGGVEIPFEKGLKGHSDADVLLHAIADALLGSLALGDIGVHFPDTDPEWKDADSTLILARSVQMVRERKFEIQNIDTTVIAEKPRLEPYMDKIRESVAAILDIPQNLVSVKATTHEKLGAVGRGEGIASHAIVLIKSSE